MLCRALLIIDSAGTASPGAGIASRLPLSRCLLQVVAMLRKFHCHGTCALGLSFMQELISRFRHCPKWVGRQAFAWICQVSVVTETACGFLSLAEARDQFTGPPCRRLTSSVRYRVLSRVILGPCSHPRQSWYLLCAEHPGDKISEEPAHSSSRPDPA